MKAPVPLEDTYPGPEAEIKKEFHPEDLRERGYLQFFFHSKESPLPIRDVTNTQRREEKMEPCIERKAENYCAECYPGNVKGFSRQDRRYMFLYTTCRYDGIEEKDDRFIVGYIEKQRVLDVEGRTAVQGPMKLVSFEEACPLVEVAPWNLRGGKKLGEEKTERVMEFLDEADNIYHDCVEAVEELERQVSRPRVWEKEDKGVPPGDEDEIFDEGTTC